MNDLQYGEEELPGESQSDSLPRRSRRSVKLPARFQDPIIESKGEEDSKTIGADADLEDWAKVSENDDHVDRGISDHVINEISEPMIEPGIEKVDENEGEGDNSQIDGNHDSGNPGSSVRSRPVRECRAREKLLTDESSREDHDIEMKQSEDEDNSEVQVDGVNVKCQNSENAGSRRSRSGKASKKRKRKLCRNCGKIFSSKNDLFSHQAACHTSAQRKKSEEKTMCVFCQVTFPSKHDRDTHLRDEHRQKKFYPCYMCERVFPASSHCKRHFLSHTGERPHSCNICGKEFADSSYVQRHMLIHSGHKPFQCDQCGRTFRERTHLSRHAETHGKEAELCRSCGKALYGNVNRCTCVESTKRRPRAASAATGTTGKDYVCEVCGKGFAKQGNYQRHRAVHKRGSQEGDAAVMFTCKVCCKEFKQKRHLHRHQRIHTGEKPFRCSECGKQFRDSSYIQRHMRIHAGHRPFQCDICQRSFRENGHLARHMLTHTGEKKFSCSTCGKGYQDKTCLLRHESKCIVSNVEPDGKSLELCDVCGKGYNGKGSLRRHQLMHTKQRSFACTQCPATFPCGSSLRRHVAIHDRDPATLNQCSQCKTLFRTERALTHHMMTHLLQATTVDRFECKLCDAEFPSRETLREHAAMHISGASASPHVKLDLPNTSRPLSLSIDLECKFCHKLFASQNILANHEITHAQSLFGNTSLPPQELSTEAVTQSAAILDPTAATNGDDFDGLLKLLQVISQFNQSQSVHSEEGVIDIAIAGNVPEVADGKDSDAGGNHLQLNRNASNFPVIGGVPADILAAGISCAGYTISSESSTDGVIRLDLVPSDSGGMCIADSPRQEMDAPLQDEVRNSEPAPDSADDDAEVLEVTSLNIEEPGLSNPTLEDPTLDDESFDADDMLTDGEEYGEEFACKYCSFSSRRDKALATHMASSHSEIVFGRQIPSKREKNEQERLHLWQCPFCNKVFKARRDRQNHSCEGVKEKPFKCNHCPMSFPKRSILTQHVKIHQVDPQFKCSFCGRTFHFKNSLTYHERIHTREEPYLCQACGKGFKDKSHLRRHEKIHEGVKPYACQICPKRFLERSQLVKHGRVHSGEKPYLCSKCGKRFADASHLLRHSKLHKEVREKSHKCLLCPKTFKTLGGLRAHTDTHSVGDALPCEVCRKEFPNRGMLNRHRRCHNAERPFACHFCAKQFRIRSQLIKHFRVHTGEKPYACSLCKKRFIDTAQCKRHIATSHGSDGVQQSELSFCDVCGEAFTESASMEEHLKSHLIAAELVLPTDQVLVKTE